MVREAVREDLEQVLKLYLYLHEQSVPALNYAKEIAVKQNCYKIMLLTGSKEQKTLEFYRKAGYNSADKTTFIQWIDG